MTTVETVPTDLPDLEWLDKDADSLGRMASFLFDPKPAPLLDDELRGVADHLLPDAIADRIAFLNRSVLNAAEPEHRRHALTHFVAVGWAKVQPMEGCQRCFPPPTSSAQDEDPVK